MAQSIPNAPAGKKINKHNALMETAGWGGYYAASTGITIAQMATNTSTMAIASAVAAGGAVSATGVGLVVAGGALTIASCAVNARSAHKSRIHRQNLREIFADRNCPSRYDCFGVGQPGKIDQHLTVSDQILPYVIKQKGKKYGRRVRYAIPGVNLFSTFRAMGTKFTKKYITHTLGVERTRAAEWLVTHLFTHNCDLTEAIIAELYSHDEMLWIKYHADEDVAVGLIAHKLRSV